MYENEEFVGKALTMSGLKRDEVFVTTKVPPERLGPGQVLATYRTSLDKLGVDAADLLLVHWPSAGGEYEMADYLGQFADILDRGLARHIGVSNFTRAHIDLAVDLLGADRIATNQCEIHVLMQNRIVGAHCAALGIPMTAYCPMARGKLQGNPVLEEIAAAHEATVGQVGLAFLMAEGHVVIPSSSSKARIVENFGALQVRLTNDDMARVRALDQGRRLVNVAWAPEWDGPR
jgi:2,5-diketo-D-gluconate reductase B